MFQPLGEVVLECSDKIIHLPVVQSLPLRNELFDPFQLLRSGFLLFLPGVSAPRGASPPLAVAASSQLAELASWPLGVAVAVGIIVGLLLLPNILDSGVAASPPRQLSLCY